MENQICYLCKKAARLQRSHIISESFYKELYENRRYSIVTADKHTKNAYEQKGIRERLLCSKCEQLLGNSYERYGASVFRGIKSKAIESLSAFTFCPVRYKEFKLFQICQLWRMAISTNSMWEAVKLPPTVEERLRQMLLEGDPGPFDCFGVMMEAVIADDKNTFDAITKAITVQIGDYDFILVTFGGFSWYFCVHSSVTDARLSRYFTAEDGSVIVGIKALRNAFHIQRLGDDLEAAGKLNSLKMDNI